MTLTKSKIELPCNYCEGVHTSGDAKTKCWQRSRQLPVSKETETHLSCSIGPEQSRALSTREKREAAKWRVANPTPSEERLDKALQRLRKNGFNFLREVNVSGYYAYFCLRRAKLIVEVDGSVHKSTELYDARRDGLLGAQGFHILRFSSERVMVEPEAVVKEIESWIKRKKIQPRWPKAKSSKVLKKTRPMGEIGHLSVNRNLEVIVPVKTAAANRIVQRSQMGKFVCLNCPERPPFVTELGEPQCFGCKRNNGTRLICTKCEQPFAFQKLHHSRVCSECRDIRQIAKDAGSGRRSDITHCGDISGFRTRKYWL